VIEVSLIDRYRGALLGLAVGDAVGTSVEFSRPGTFEPVTDMEGGGPFGLRAGQWTDDTSMALCLATSLLETGAFDPLDQMTRYVRWWRDGYLSSTGNCFDIGNTISAALSRFERTGDPWSGSTDRMAAGNGSLMRLAPVPLAYAPDPVAAVRRAADSSRTTHGALEAVDACRYYAALIVGALGGEPKERILSPEYALPGIDKEMEPLASSIEAIATGSFAEKSPPEIAGTGYSVKSLEAALWSFWNSDNFRDGCLLAVNLGDDADTTAAVYGQIAGAFYGESGIPDEWLQRLHEGAMIGGLAESLYDMAQDPSALTD
jgi:ADP-ribosyl-[dinitrogen reductase] hydrolase